MHPSWMDDTLDSIVNYEFHTQQLFEHQKIIYSQTFKVFSSEPPAKRRKPSKQCSGADGKENIFTARTAQYQQSSSTKICSFRRQTMKMDSSFVETNLNPCRVTYFKETDGGKLNNKLIDAQGDPSAHRNFGNEGQSDEVELSNLAMPPRTSCLGETKTITSPPKFDPVRGRKRGVVVKAGPSSISSAAIDSLNVLPGAEKLEKVNDDPEVPLAALPPLRMTRARAKTLKNCGALSVAAQYKEPVKKPRAQKGRARALPQATPLREVEQSLDVIADVQATGAATLQDSQNVFGRDEELNKPRRGCRQKESANVVLDENLAKIGDVSVILLDVQGAEGKNATIQLVGAHDDRYNQGIEGARIGGKREDDDDLSLAELDSERWEDIKRSVKVRKGRGRAVSSFLGHGDSDLFPPRSFAPGPDNVFDLALEQGMKDVENARSPEEGMKVVMLAGRFPDSLPTMDAAAFDSTQKNLQRELGFDGGRKHAVQDCRQSDASPGDNLVTRQFFVYEESSAEPRKRRVSRDVILGSPAASGLNLTVRPFSGAFEGKASTHKKARSVQTSRQGGESRKSDEEQAISPLEPEEPFSLDSSTARNVSTAGNMSPADRTPTRGNVSPWEQETSNKEVTPLVSSQVKGDKSSAQITVGGQINLFREVFTLKTPLRSQRRNVTEVSADCTPRALEASPPFHVPGASTIRKSGSVNNGLSHSHELRTSSPVEEYEAGVSSVKIHATLKPPRIAEGQPNRMDLSGGGLLDESAKVLSILKMTDTSAKTRLQHDLSSPARVDLRDRTGFNITAYEDHYKNGRFCSFSPEFLQKSGKLGSQTRAVTVTPDGLLGNDKRPLDLVHTAVIPPQEVSNENCSGDTMVLSDDDDQDTSTSRLKSFGSSRQAENGQLPPSSASCRTERLSLSMILTFEDPDPREVSLRYGMHKADSELAVNEIGNYSNVKISQFFEHGSGPGGLEVKGYKVTPEQNPVRDTHGSGGFAERLEASKRTPHSPLWSEQPKRSRLSVAELSGRSCAMRPVESKVDPQTNLPVAVGEVNAAESLKQAGGDVHSGSTVHVSGEDRGFGAESSGNTSIETRRTPTLKSLHGHQYHVLARQRLEDEDFSGDNESADDEDAAKEDTDLTDAEECSGDSEAGTEEMVEPRESLKLRINSFGRKSTSRKEKEQGLSGDHQYSDHNQQDQRRLEAVAHSPSRCPSYQGKGVDSVHYEECSENSSRRGTKVKRAVELLCAASCPTEGYVHHSDVGGLQRDSNLGECEIADIKTPISSYGNAGTEEKSTAKAEKSRERPRTSSNIVNPCAQSSRLLSNVRTLIPVCQRPAPTFIPNGKRDVKVKALEAAEAARRLQEKRETEKRERMQKRADAIARRAIEKEKAKEEMLKAEHESKAAQKVVSENSTAKDVSAPTAKAVLTDCTNSKSLQSPKSKWTRALALKTKIEQEKAKKLEEESRKKEEERRKKEAEIVARKRKKEEAEKKERKRRRQEELLKQRREQEERLRAELEEKEHRHRLLEEAERERKAQEEEARRQRRAERERERERRQKEELEAKTARQADKEAERKRKEEAFLVYKASEEHDHRVAENIGAASTASKLRSQRSTGLSTDKLRASNLLSTGTCLSFALSARVPSTSFEGRTLMIATPMVPNKAPISSLPAIKSKSLGTGPTIIGKIAEMDTGPKTFATPTLAAVEHADTGPQSYEISPYRSSSDDEDEERRERAKKFIPAWASKENLMPQLLRQLTQDPDEIFAGTKTCSLKEVFGTSGSKKVLDFGRRSGSGDWVKDRVSWKEELQYKIDMGYMSHMH